MSTGGRVFISARDRRMPLLAPMASNTRVHFSVRQARVISCSKWLVYISACVTADAADWSRTDSILNKLVNQSLRISDRALHAGKSGRYSKLFLWTILLILSERLSELKSLSCDRIIRYRIAVNKMTWFLLVILLKSCYAGFLFENICFNIEI